MKEALLADIERGFESLKAKLDFAPKVTQLESELAQARDDLDQVRKSQSASVKSVYAYQNNMMDRLVQIK